MKKTRNHYTADSHRELDFVVESVTLASEVGDQTPALHLSAKTSPSVTLSIIWSGQGARFIYCLRATARLLGATGRVLGTLAQ